MLRTIFGTRLTRRVTTDGIHLFGLVYNSKALQTYRQQIGDLDVELRIDAQDIDFISVRVDPFWLAVPCVHEGFRRITLRKWIEMRADVSIRLADDATVVREAIRRTQKMPVNVVRFTLKHSSKRPK